MSQERNQVEPQVATPSSSQLSHQLSHQLSKDAEDLKRMGYVQELLREMGGFSNFAVSFSVISILTGATQLYGYGLQHGGPLQMTVGWGTVSFFTLFVALAMAELASAYPTSGALYHWSSILGGRGYGWLTACFNTLGQFAIVAGIDYGLAQFLSELLNRSNANGFVFGLYSAILFSHCLLNHMGISVVGWLNRFSAWYHMVVVGLILVVLLKAGFAQPFHFSLTFHSTDGFSTSHSFLIGLLLAQWTLTGYDASAHVTEETVDPKKNAPWGIFLSVAVSILFGGLMLLAITLSIPNLAQATGYGDGAFMEILKSRLGTQMGTGIAGLVAGAMWLCGLSSMTSASRMVFAFARDGGLLKPAFLAKVSRKHRTPSNAIWVLGGLSLMLALSVKVYSAVVSVATVALYISYGLPILARLYSSWSGSPDKKGPWNLRGLSIPVALIALLWICFISVLFILPPNQEAGIIISIFSLSLSGIWYFHARHRFAGPRVLLAGEKESVTVEAEAFLQQANRL